MNSSSDYCLFGHPVPPRAYYWSWLLCPGLALMIYLSTRSRIDERLSPFAKATGDLSGR